MEVAIVIAFCLVMFVLAIKVYDKKEPAFLDTEYHPELEAAYTGKKVEEPEKKDISEPVYAFVRTVKENPKRFSVRLDFEATDRTHNKVFKFRDRQLKKEWTFIKYPHTTYSKARFYGGPDWLTVDEREFIYEELFPIFGTGVRKKRLNELKRLRMKRIYK